MSTRLFETCRGLKYKQKKEKIIVRQVGHLPELYRDARLTKHKSTNACYFMKDNTTAVQRDKLNEFNCDKCILQMTAYTKITTRNLDIHVSMSVGQVFREDI
jgi:hypothetical protein